MLGCISTWGYFFYSNNWSIWISWISPCSVVFWVLVLIGELSVEWVKGKASLRLLTISVLFSTLEFILWVIFLNYSRVRVPIVGDTQRNFSLLLNSSRTGVTRTVVWIYTFCVVDVEAWIWILVIIGDLGGGGLLVFCLEMFNYVPPCNAIFWWPWFIGCWIKYKVINRRRQSNQKGFKSIPPIDYSIPYLFEMTNFYGYKTSNGTMFFRSE